MVMSFTVNGEHQGMAYEIQHAELGDKALFPHIVTKNMCFKVCIYDIACMILKLENFNLLLVKLY